VGVRDDLFAAATSSSSRSRPGTRSRTSAETLYTGRTGS
jgi:hypothetical protein